MKLNNGQNIITDNDITMTGFDPGCSLHQVINKQSEDINTLKSNVKWMYKHGSAGSGGPGGGSGNSQLWNYRVELGNKDKGMAVYRDKEKVNFGVKGDYKLILSLFKVQGRTFNIKITWPTENGMALRERVIPPTASAKLEEILNLLVNGDIKISINDDEGNTSEYTLTYVVAAYNFNINYVLGDEKHTPYNPEIQDHNIFVNQVLENGLFVHLNYNINTEYTKAQYRYIDWVGNTSEWIPINEPIPSKPIYLPIGKELIDENAGNYTFLVEVELRLAGAAEDEKITPLKLLDNLIPNNTYLKVETDGIIYNDKNNPKPYSFNAGDVAFKITPFQGYLDPNNTFDLKVYLNDELVTGIITLLLDQKTLTITVSANEINFWNSIRFYVKRGTSAPFDKTYYFYTKSGQGNFLWYPELIYDNGQRIIPEISYQYHASGLGPKSLFKDEIGLNYLLDSNNHPMIGKGEINKIMQDDKSSIFKGNFNKLIDLTKPESFKYRSYDFMAAIGIKYNKLNDISKEILQINGKDNNDIVIYQNKINIGGANYNIYIPKDNQYHLLTLYKRAVNERNTLPLFEINLYIDGVLEASILNFIQILELYDTIKLSSGLYSVNYMEMSYFKHTPGKTDVSSIDHFEAYNKNPNKELLDYFNDQSILYHYYSYKLSLVKTGDPDPFPEGFKEAYNFASKFYTNYNTNRIEVTQLLIADAAKNLKIPTLVLNYTAYKSNEDYDYTGEEIFKWMETGYEISSRPDIVNDLKDVKIEWSAGGSALSEIKTGTNNASFKIGLLGTSTLNYRNKNFDLILDNNDEKLVFLFSPNYNANDTNTFLPEKRFTLKADIVDSSHSNNNALGKFINTVTTKFQGALQTDNNYSKFIKNTLEGFPVLLFFKNRYFETETAGTETEDYYFLGIYNFNLGRDSEFNLGYKDLRLLPERIPEGFNVTAIDKSKKIDDKTTLDAGQYLNGFGVSEIRENRNYFDFSQYDDSILFAINDTDKDYMFGKNKSNGNEYFLKPRLRDLVTGVCKAGGFIFDKLEKTKLTDDSDGVKCGYENGYKSKEPMNIVPNYNVQYRREIQNAQSKLIKNKQEPNADISNLYTTILGIKENDNYLNPLVDYTALSEYYVCCMALGLVDSVSKNLNLKTWNGKTFYASFYDMDTALGKDNAGNDTDYMAFSDFWIPKITKIGEKYQIEPAMSYKDWCKPDYPGYDTPMSYLLALAKYSYYAADKDSEEKQLLKDWYPNNIWARFRREDTTIPNWIQPQNINKNHIGCLKNADVFINNYFKKHLENVPDVFFNLNYRKKYFVTLKSKNIESVSGYIEDDYRKFSGRRIYSVHDWLEGRLHILDLYFNLSRIPDSVKKYNNGKWEIITNEQYPLADPQFIDKTNQDIIIILDIFNALKSSDAIKYSYNIDVDFKAETDSPLCILGNELNQLSITDDNLYLYNLQINSAGKAVGLGGSKNWTYINKLDNLILNNSLYINSDKLTNLVGFSGECNAWLINLPALETVNLVGKLYTGNLSFEKSNTVQYPNLKSINISGSKLGLKLDNLNVKEIIADNVQSQGDLRILNCNLINKLSYKNSRFTNIELTASSKESYFNVNGYTKEWIGNEEIGEWKDTNLSSNAPKCKRLNITRKEGDGAIWISKLEYTENNTLQGLEEITLSGYKEIYIDDCDYLKYLNIKDPSNVKILKITNSSGSLNNEKLRINSATPGMVDLHEFINLQKFNFRNTKNFNVAILPNNTQLFSECFAWTNLLYLRGAHTNDIFKLCNSAFHNSGYTLLQKENGPLTNFIIADDVTNLSMTFHSANIKLDTFKTFNDIHRNELSHIINASSMWSYNYGLRYTDEMLNNDVKNKTCSIDLSMYSAVKNASSMLANPRNTTCHPDILKGLGSKYLTSDKNYEGLNIRNIFGFNEAKNKQIIKIPINWLEYVKDRVSDFNQGNSYNISFNVIEKINKNTTTLNPVKKFTIKDFLPGNKYIKTIENWIFSPYHDENSNQIYHIVDFIGNPFKSSEYPNLKTIYKSFCGCEADNLLTKVIEYDRELEYGFLYDKTPSLVNIDGSFGFVNYNKFNINLFYMFNWAQLSEDFKNNGNERFLNIFHSGDETWDKIHNVGIIPKKIESLNAFETIFNTLLKTYSGERMINVFRNCEVIAEDRDVNFDHTIKNYSINDISYLFNNLKFYKPSQSNTEEIPIKWDWDIMELFPEVHILKGTFENMWFTKSIPFNFFKTRNDSKTESVFVKESIKSEFIAATRHIVEYEKNKITNILRCFKNCKFDEHTFTLIERTIPSIIKYDYSIVGGYLPEYVEYINGLGQIVYTDKYYPGITASEYEVYNPDYDDLNKSIDYIGGRDDVVIDISDPNFSFVNYNNFYLYNSNKTPFITPDFFYSCSGNVKAEECFSGCDLQGYIPDNMFRNSKLAELKDFIKHVLIFPKLYKILFNRDKNEKFDIYYYLGHKFINTTVLDNFFNFRICLPKKTVSVENQNDIINQHTLHVFSFIDSFDENITSAKNAFAVNINGLELSNYIFGIQNEPNDVYLNLMYDHKTEIIDKTGDEIIGKLGLNLLYYNRLNLDKVVNCIISQFTYGDLFDTKTTLGSIKLENISDSNWGILFGNDTIPGFTVNKEEFNGIGAHELGISYNMKLPSAPTRKAKLINVVSLTYDIYKKTHVPDGMNQIINTNNGITDESIDETNYNKSLNHDISYGIDYYTK